MRANESKPVIAPDYYIFFSEKWGLKAAPA